jgi:hypothetical protein
MYFNGFLEIVANCSLHGLDVHIKLTEQAIKNPYSENLALSFANYLEKFQSSKQ